MSGEGILCFPLFSHKIDDYVGVLQSSFDGVFILGIPLLKQNSTSSQRALINP